MTWNQGASRRRGREPSVRFAPGDNVERRSERGRPALELAIALAFFSLTSLASAVSLGELVVDSGAAERLEGRIALVGAEGLRAQEITVALGSKEDFGNLGLERFNYLDTLRFQVAPPYVRVSSSAPIPDAYLNFIVRLTWPGGTSLREYAVLLNSPRSAPSKSPASIPVDKPKVVAARTERTVTVQPNDTLWSIAAANLPPDGTNVQQQMLAILRENPHAFAAANINGLVAGATLRLPDAGASTGLSPQEAIEEASRQNDAWGAGSGGQLRILDSAEDSPPPQTITEPPADSIGVGDSPPAPPLADLLQEARRQIREQARQLQRRDEEIARLSSELAALRTTHGQERQDWMQALGRWRIAALAGLLPTAGLIAVGLVALRRRRGARRAEPSDAPDYDFGAPIGDGRVKLNLAKAYIDLDDQASAREVLAEVIASGTDQERSEAQSLLERLAEGPSQPVPP